MKHLLSLSLILSLLFAKAQFVTHSYNDPEFQQFLKTKKTYVMLTGDQEFDSLLTAAVKQYWKVSPFEFLPLNKMEKLMSDPQYSFLKPMVFYTYIQGGGDNSTTVNNMLLSVVNGSPKEYKSIDQVAFVCLEPKAEYIASRGDLELDGTYLRERFRLADLVATLNKSIEIVRDKKYEYKAGCENAAKFLLANEYNQHLSELKNKTLYILKNNFARPEEIAKAYPFKYKVVDVKEYTSAIREGRKGIAYLMLAHSSWGGITVVDPSSHEMLGGVHISRCYTIDGGDVKDLVKAMEKAEKEKK